MLVASCGLIVGIVIYVIHGTHDASKWKGDVLGKSGCGVSNRGYRLV